MKVFRPIHLEKCVLCGKEADRLTMYEVFTGRTRYICRDCKIRGIREMDARIGQARAARKAMDAETKKRRQR